MGIIAPLEGHCSKLASSGTRDDLFGPATPEPSYAAAPVSWYRSWGQAPSSPARRSGSSQPTALLADESLVLSD